MIQLPLCNAIDRKNFNDHRDFAATELLVTRVTAKSPVEPELPILEAFSAFEHYLLTWIGRI
jgi:hypothetical protein